VVNKFNSIDFMDKIFTKIKVHLMN
jgi:hypothetical protein